MWDNYYFQLILLIVYLIISMAAHEALFCDHFAMAIHFIRLCMWAWDNSLNFMWQIYIYICCFYGAKKLIVNYQCACSYTVCESMCASSHRVYMNYKYKSNSGIYGYIYSLSKASCLVCPCYCCSKQIYNQSKK
jgi:hypothetical protein